MLHPQSHKIRGHQCSLDEIAHFENIENARLVLCELRTELSPVVTFVLRP